MNDSDLWSQLIPLSTFSIAVGGSLNLKSAFCYHPFHLYCCQKFGGSSTCHFYGHRAFYWHALSSGRISSLGGHSIGLTIVADVRSGSCHCCGGRIKGSWRCLAFVIPSWRVGLRSYQSHGQIWSREMHSRWSALLKFCSPKKSNYYPSNLEELWPTYEVIQSYTKALRRLEGSGIVGLNSKVYSRWCGFSLTMLQELEDLISVWS